MTVRPARPMWLACILATNTWAAEPPVMTPGQVTERSLIDALILPKPAAQAGEVRDSRDMSATPPPSAAVDAEAPASGIPASRSRGFRPLTRPAAPPVPAQAARKAHILMTFETNSVELTPDTVRVLDQLARAMNSSELDGTVFVVEGHADARGDAALNLALSQRRAEAVVDHLRLNHRLAADRLSASGKGASEPLNTLRLDAPENRRVTIVSRRP